MPSPFAQHLLEAFSKPGVTGTCGVFCLSAACFCRAAKDTSLLIKPSRRVMMLPQGGSSAAQHREPGRVDSDRHRNEQRQAGEERAACACRIVSRACFYLYTSSAA